MALAQLVVPSFTENWQTLFTLFSIVRLTCAKLKVCLGQLAPGNCPGRVELGQGRCNPRTPRLSRLVNRYTLVL